MTNADRIRAMTDEELAIEGYKVVWSDETGGLTMNEYISKGNAIFAVSALPLTLDAETTQRAIEAVRHVPAADVVEVVRCKDCKHFEQAECPWDELFVINVNDYCSRGERKGDKA